MKISIILISFLLSVSVFANIGHDPYKTLRGKTLNYTNYFSGDKVGKLTITVKDSSKDDKSKTHVKIYNKFNIRKFLVFTYNYKVKMEVILGDNGIMYSTAKSNIDGKKYNYYVKFKDGKLVMTNLRKKNKETDVKPFTDMSLNFIYSKEMQKNLTNAWKTDIVLDIETGKMSKVKVKRAGTKTIKVKGVTYDTFMTKWKKGPRKGKSYYDVKTGVLVRSDVTKSGNTMKILLNSIK